MNFFSRFIQLHKVFYRRSTFKWHCSRFTWHDELIIVYWRIIKAAEMKFHSKPRCICMRMWTSPPERPFIPFQNRKVLNRFWGHHNMSKADTLHEHEQDNKGVTRVCESLGVFYWPNSTDKVRTLLFPVVTFVLEIAHYLVEKPVIRPFLPSSKKFTNESFALTHSP